MRYISYVISVVLISFLFTACGVAKNPTKDAIKKKTAIPEIIIVEHKLDKKELKETIKQQRADYLYGVGGEKTFSVLGEGLAPDFAQKPAQKIALAKRAAITDAYRQLGEKLYGVRINSRETIKDATLRDSRIVAKVDGLIKDAEIVSTNYKDELYTVRMEVKVDRAVWQEIFSYSAF